MSHTVTKEKILIHSVCEGKVAVHGPWEMTEDVEEEVHCWSLNTTKRVSFPCLLHRHTHVTRCKMCVSVCGSFVYGGV